MAIMRTRMIMTIMTIMTILLIMRNLMMVTDANNDMFR